MLNENKSPLEPAYRRLVDFCVWSDLSPATVHRLCRKGLLRKIKVGSASLIDMSSARELFRSGYRGSVRD